ncbi:MAG: toll/interleukin-1 receptor domain-containing protein [Luteolibacter sp.]
MTKPVFISHAEADKPLVDHFVTTLLVPGLNLTTLDYFCTSLPGAGNRTGKSFHEYIKNEIKGCRVIVLILTSQYLESPFCLAEAGAAWVLENDDSCQVIPVVVPPLKFSELKATLAIMQAEKIDEDEDLDDVRDALSEAGVLKNDPKTAQWSAAKLKFQKGLPAVLEEMVPPTKIDPKKHAALEETNELLVEQITEAEEKIKELKVQIEELEKCGNSSEVLAVKVKHSGALEQFALLTQKLKSALSDHDQFVDDVLYYGFNNQSIRVPQNGTGDSDEFWESFRSASERNLVYEDPSEGVNLDHPKLRNAVKTLQEISDFVSNYGSEIESFVENEWECTLDMADKEFWDNITGGRSILPRPRK